MCQFAQELVKALLVNETAIDQVAIAPPLNAQKECTIVNLSNQHGVIFEMITWVHDKRGMMFEMAQPEHDCQATNEPATDSQIMMITWVPNK